MTVGTLILFQPVIAIERAHEAIEAGLRGGGCS
jgi:hypothetical protein